MEATSSWCNIEEQIHCLLHVWHAIIFYIHSYVVGPYFYVQIYSVCVFYMCGMPLLSIFTPMWSVHIFMSKHIQSASSICVACHYFLYSLLCGRSIFLCPNIFSLRLLHVWHAIIVYIHSYVVGPYFYVQTYSVCVFYMCGMPLLSIFTPMWSVHIFMSKHIQSASSICVACHYCLYSLLCGRSIFLCPNIFSLLTFSQEAKCVHRVWVFMMLD